LGALLLFIHIVAAGTWLGASMTRMVVTPAMQKTGGAPAAAWMRQTVRMGVLLYTPAAAVLLVTGSWMVIRENVFDFEQTFVVIGFVVVVVGALLGARVFGPGGRATADLHDAGETAAAGVAHKRLAVYGAVDTLLVLFTIWAMVKRLGI
jgi:hypothetical protein